MFVGFYFAIEWNEETSDTSVGLFLVEGGMNH